MLGMDYGADSKFHTTINLLVTSHTVNMKKRCSVNPQIKEDCLGSWKVVKSWLKRSTQCSELITKPSFYLPRSQMREWFAGTAGKYGGQHKGIFRAIP